MVIDKSKYIFPHYSIGSCCLLVRQGKPFRLIGPGALSGYSGITSFRQSWRWAVKKRLPISVYRLSLLDSIGIWHLSERIFTLFHPRPVDTWLCMGIVRPQSEHVGLYYRIALSLTTGDPIGHRLGSGGGGHNISCRLSFAVSSHSQTRFFDGLFLFRRHAKQEAHKSDVPDEDFVKDQDQWEGNQPNDQELRHVA